MTPHGLFPDCVLPGCRNPVEYIGEACGPCQYAFDDLLRPSDKPALTASEVDDRDRAVRIAYANRRPAA